MMFCMNCGKKINEMQKNCDSCGASQNILSSVEEENTQVIHMEKENESTDSPRPNSNLVKCPHCAKEIAKTATVCPSCGGESEYAAELKKSELEEAEKLKKAKLKGLIPIVIIGFIIFFAWNYVDNYIERQDSAFKSEMEYKCRLVTNLPCK